MIRALAALALALALSGCAGYAILTNSAALN